MYGQGNYATQSGQNANASRPQLQQWPPAPAPPPPAQASRPPMLPHGHPPGPPLVGQRGPPAYQHSHPGVHHPCPPFSVSTSCSESGQFYPLPPPPPSAQVHGSAPILQSHQVPVQHSQWNPSMHHVPPSIAPGAPRVLPPPPPLGQMPYRGAIHQPSPNGMQVFLHNLPPPPPPPPNLQNPGFSTPSPFDPSAHSRNHDSHVQPAVPGPQPPLPPSPPGDPPLPPSSPPLIYTTGNANGAKDGGVFEHDGGIACREGLPVSKSLASGLPSSPPKPLSLAFPGEGSSVQLINSINSAPSHSAADSDMEMEDDITQLVEDQQIHPLGAEKQLQDGVTEDILYRNSSCYGPLEPEEQRQDSPYRAPSSFQEPSSESNGLNRDNEPFLDGHVQTSSSLEDGHVQTSSSLEKNLSHPRDKEVGLENVHSQLMEATSPFRLIQGYASDDSLDNTSENCLENLGRLMVPSPSEVVTITVKTDTGRSPISSVKLSNSVVKNDKESVGALNFEDSIDHSNGNRLSFKSDTAPEGPHSENVLGANDNDSFDSLREDAKDKSPTRKVDEFGRLVREGVSDSDSDESRKYMRRHGKRGRNQSRSRSPYDRRRRKSPWKRKDRRDRSRSISPKRHRSRSKSPSRHGSTSGGDKMRRDRGYPSQCFNFLRGRCYHGASCRYFHAELDKSGRSRSYRSKHQQRDLPLISKDSDMHNSKDSHTREKIGTTLKKSVHNHDRSESQDIPDMEMKDMKEPEPTSQLYGKENQMGLADSPVIVAEVEKLPSDAAGGMPSSIGTMGIHQSEDHVSGQMLLSADEKLKEKCDSSVLELPSVQTSFMVPPVQLPQFVSAKDSGPSDVLQTALLSASFPSTPQTSSTAFAQQMPRDHNLPPPFNSAYIESAPPFQAPFPHQPSPFAVPLSSSWNSLPPLPALSQAPRTQFVSDSSGNAAGGQHSVPQVHFQPNVVAPRNDFYASTSPNIPQVGEHHAFVRTQPIYSRGSPNRPPVFLGESLALGELPGPSSKSYPYMQQPHSGTQTAGISRHLVGVSSSVSRYASDLLDQNQALRLPDFGGSRFSSHFNPYASTFDQPLTTKFSSDPLIHGRDMLSSSKYSAFSLSNLPIDGHHAESLGSRNITPPSARTGEAMFPQPGGNQYDPLYDSIEPSTNLLKKSDPGQKHEVTGDSGVMLRLSGSNEPLNVEVNKRQKGGGAITFTASAENDEFGETAEAEVGAVENGSLSDSSDEEDVPTGEIEIEQVKPSTEKKKSKDSRSMKLFKISVANFVKELLKPSWRQGNMSKEVFKTIVKKTVDKVSGAMKSHQIPKSKTKIDHYIDSSQRKLTKLVMGYVDKYVKA